LVNGGNVSYRQLQLASGPMNAYGSIDIVNGAVSGSVNAALGGSAGVVARAALTAGGKVNDPVLR